jgi:hypothetical protein
VVNYSMIALVKFSVDEHIAFIADAVRGPDGGGDDVLREPATRGHHRPERSFSKSGDVGTGAAVDRVRV